MQKAILIPLLGGDVVKVEQKDILYLLADNHTIIVHLTNKRVLKTSKTLEKFSETLSKDQFFQIHRSRIINIKHMDKHNFKKMIVTMQDGKELGIARPRLQELKKFLNEVLEEIS